MKRIVFILEIVALLVSVYVGCIYYLKYSTDVIKYVLLIVENTLSCFVLNSKIKLVDIINVEFSNNAFINSFVFIIYAISIYIAPICLMSQFILAFSNLKYAIKDFVFKVKCYFAHNILIIFGFNDNVLALLENEMEAENSRFVFVFTDKEISMDLRYKFISHNIKFYDSNFNTKQSKKHKGRDEFILNKISDVLLFDDNVLVNITNLALIENKLSVITFNTKKNINIYIYTKSYQEKTLVQQYVNNDFNNANLLINYEIIDLNYIISRKLCVENNNFENNSHAMIIGYGDLGATITNIIVNNSLFNHTNTVRVDIIDNNLPEAKNNFLKHIKNDYLMPVDEDRNHYRLSNSQYVNDFRCEGTLDIFLHKLDIYDNNFFDELYRINVSGDSPINNIFICLKAGKTSIDCLNSIIEFKTKKQEYFSKKIFVRLDSKKDGLKFIDYKNNKNYYNVIPFTGAKEILSIDNIVDNCHSKKTKDYAYIYNVLKNKANCIFKKCIDDFNLIDKIDDYSEQDIRDAWSKKSIFEKEYFEYFMMHMSIVFKTIGNKFVSIIEEYLHYIVKINDSNNDDYRKTLNSFFSSNTYHLLCNEHRRSNYFLALNGWRYSNIPIVDYIKKEDNNMMCYKKLCLNDKKYILSHMWLYFNFLNKYYNDKRKE